MVGDNQIIAINNEINILKQQVERCNDILDAYDSHDKHEIDYVKSMIHNINQQLISQQYAINSLVEQLSPYILANNNITLDENDNKKLTIFNELSNKIDNQQKQLDTLIADYTTTKAYLDNIDDTLDMFEDIITNLTQENETILMSLVRMKAEIDTYIVTSIKEKIVLTSAVSVIIHDLIIHGVINIQDYTINFKKLVDEIVNVYKKNGVDLDLTEELKTLDGSSFSEDHISIRVPNITTDVIRENCNEDSNIVSLNELKRKAAEKKRIIIKPPATKKKKSAVVKNNIIENISEQLQALHQSHNNILNISLNKSLNMNQSLNTNKPSNIQPDNSKPSSNSDLSTQNTSNDISKNPLKPQPNNDITNNNSIHSDKASNMHVLVDKDDSDE